MPPAFVLSQDQTLRKINYFIRKSDSKHLKLCCFDYIGKPMSQIEFSRLHRTIQFSISCHFWWRLIIYHSLFRLSSEILKIFEIFLISVSFSPFALSSAPETKRCLIYHQFYFCQTQVWRFFNFFQINRFAPHFPVQSAKHHLIYHRSEVCQIKFAFF